MHIVVWMFWQQSSDLSELKFDVKFCEIKVEDLQATPLILLAYVGVRDIEKF